MEPEKTSDDPLPPPKKTKKDMSFNLFVPAVALQHNSNPEKCTRVQKIKWAVLRKYQYSDFNTSFEVFNQAQYVILQKIEFNPKDLGYQVKGFIICG